jgi:hypothetical protein
MPLQNETPNSTRPHFIDGCDWESQGAPIDQRATSKDKGSNPIELIVAPLFDARYLPSSETNLQGLVEKIFKLGDFLAG